MNLIEVVDDGAVRTIAINRPERRNALSFDTLVQLREAVTEARVRAELRAVILTGRGGAFSSGADVREWAEKKAKGERSGDWVGEALQLMQDVFEFPKPTIAMMDGAAAGAGLDLALACDFRFASERARFICSYTRVGFSPDAGSSWLLPRLIGIEKAKRFVYTGDSWTADVALANGLITEKHPVETLESATMAFAYQLASGPTVAIGLAKSLIDSGHRRSFAEALREEQRAGRICGQTEDHREGLKAVNEKRQPVFVGR
jgi:2-(1,2-epoxy-1,2-dihydrophenyl)acetyl-CoA isomerase